MSKSKYGSSHQKCKKFEYQDDVVQQWIRESRYKQKSQIGWFHQLSVNCVGRVFFGGLERTPQLRLSVD